MGETSAYFQQQTSSIIFQQLSNYADKANHLLMRIEDQENLFNEADKQFNIIQDYEQARQSDVDSGSSYWVKSQQLVDAEKRLIEMRERFQINELYKEGYKLLNEIGHYFHGEWQYSITLFGKENYTFQMGMEQFLKYTHATVNGFVLDSKTSILSQLVDTQIEGVKKIKWDNNRTDRYNKKTYNNYAYVIQKARNILTNGGTYSVAKYNAGQLLEGYMAYGEDEENLSQINVIGGLVRLASRRHLGIENFGALEDSVLDVFFALQKQTNTRGFWSGGDTAGEGQVKGANASVFSFSTIKNQLNKVKNLFGQLDFSKLEEKVNQAKPEARQALEKEIRMHLNEVGGAFDKLIGGFDATTISSNLGSEIQSIIDSLL